MKIIYKEHSPVNYAQYHFPYRIYGIRENEDSYAKIYENGFLPYTNELSIADEIYYLARSVRVDLKRHKFRYKQKNVFNTLKTLFDDDKISFRLIEKSVLSKDKTFISWCLKNAKNGFLSKKRLDYILSRPYLKDILVISEGNRILAYLLIVREDKNFLHVWYSFYDLSIRANNFGKWILLKTIDWCQKHGFDYFYIGTCYSKAAFYKLTLSPSTCYFDGNEWNEDVSGLRRALLE